MFRPSCPLLFKPMTALNKLHHPLPLSPRESQQLLNLLTTSFRAQLDAAHGFREGSDVATSATTTTRTRRDNRQGVSHRPRSYSDSDARPTDQHLRSILSNPLFSHRPNWNNAVSAKDPMDGFEEAVAKGLMNVETAKDCLRAKRREIIESPALSVRTAMRESGAGGKVLKWLIHSGTANNNTFLQDQVFADILMQFMIAEGLQEAAWVWIKTALETFKSDPTHHRSAAGPLLSLVKAESFRSNDLSSSYMVMSRASGYLKDLGRDHMRIVLGPSGRFLFHEIYTMQRDHKSHSDSAFESFLGLIPVLTKHTEFHFAYLALFHPSRPNAQQALSYLRERRPFLSAFNKPAASWGVSEQMVIRLGLETAKFLLANEKFRDVEWTMAYLQEHFPAHLDMKQEQRLAQARAEASSLQLLDGLSLA